MNDKLEIRAIAAPWWAGVELLIKSSGKVASITMIEVPPDIVLEPTCHISKREAQTLMDDLWGAGLRPSEGTGSAGSLKATENHLEDMRKIVFQKLNIT